MLKKAKVIYYLNDVSNSSKREFSKLLLESNVNFLIKADESLRHFVSFLPPGTILAQSYGIEDKSQIICLPMFSSHISLPLKQGEFVWYMSDDDSKKRENAYEVFKSHPLISINDYWISRIHGTLISEDLNYSYKERDAIVSANKLTDSKEIIIPDFENTSIFTPGSVASQNISTKSLYEKGRNTFFGDKATPRMFSKTDDLTIQGSYNTLLNFTSSDSKSSQSTSREGLIDIVSGRLALQDYISLEGEKIIKVGEKIINNSISLENKQKTIDFEYSSKKYLEIKNNLGGKEIFKVPNFYLNEEIPEFDVIEDKINYDSDASRIMISESINIDNGIYYDTEFLDETFSFVKFSEDDLINEVSIEKNYLKNSELKILNIKEENLEYQSFDFEDEQNEIINFVSLPTVLIKTNNIRIISRKRLEKNKFKLPAGNIRLIKEDDKFLNYSQVLMENDGNILIDGRSIKIGDFRKEVMKVNNINTLDEFIDKFENEEGILNIDYNNEFIKNMHGNGYGVLLGYNENLSEPLVLGNTLNAVLNEIIDVTKESLNKISDHVKAREDELNIEMKKLNVWISSVGGILGVPMPLPMNENYNSDKLFDNLEAQQEKLTNIQNNLSDILSRFSKTS